jgi:hypothetical protein
MMSHPHLRAGLSSTVAEVNFIRSAHLAVHLFPPGHWTRAAYGMYPEALDVLRQTRDVVWNG